MECTGWMFWDMFFRLIGVVCCGMMTVCIGSLAIGNDNKGDAQACAMGAGLLLIITALFGFFGIWFFFALIAGYLLFGMYRIVTLFI